MKITKRNGQVVEFNKSKISAAVDKAYLSVYGFSDGSMGDAIADFIETSVSLGGGNTTVEKVQDLVEDYLIAYCADKSIAKEYIRYRHKRKLERQKEEIEEKLLARNVQNQNANVDEYSFGGRVGETASVVTKQYALDNLVSRMARSNHEHNRIYLHDLDSYAAGMHNCLSVPFDDLLAKGFNTRQTDVRPANSVNTAFQLVAVIFQIQSLQQFGGVSATHLDWTMVPYVRKSFVKHFKDGLRYCEDSTLPLVLNKSLDDSRWLEQLSIYDSYFLECQAAHNYALDMTIRETYQAVEGLFHNLNTLQSRSGNQLK